MAEKTSGSDFEAKITDLSGGGGNYSAQLPSYVLDKTVRDVGEALTKVMTTLVTDNAKALEEQTKRYREALEKSVEENKSGQEEINETQEKILSEAEKNREQNKLRREQEAQDRKEEMKELAGAISRGAIKGGRIGGDLLVSAIKGIAVIFGTAGGIMLNSFSNLGNGLRTLTDTGQAFGDQLGAGTMSTTENIVAMNLMGLTTEEAVSSLAQYSRAMSTMGQSTLIGLNKSFLDATNNGASLGVTLDEATEFFLTDQQFRARTLNKDRIDQSITAQLTMQSIQNLRGFSSILGQSTDALRQQSEGVMDGNKAFMAFTNTLNPAKATEMNAVARSLVEGLIAVFPTAGEDLSNALLSVAGTGVGAISEFANMLIPLGGTLYDNFQGLANDLRAGTITMEDVPSAIASIVDSSAMNVEELDRLRVIAGLEGHQMQSVAETIIQMQQDASMARDRLQKLADSTGMQYDTIQTTTVGFQNIMKTLRGGYSSLLNSIPIEATKELAGNFEKLLEAFTGKNGGVSVLNTELQRAGSEIGQAIGETINSLAGEDGFATTIRSVIDSIIGVTKSLLDRIERIIRRFSDEEGKIDFGGAIKQLIAEGIGLAFEVIATAFANLPWGSIILSAPFVAAWLALSSSIGIAFTVAAGVAAQAFSMAALRVAATAGFVGPMRGAGRGGMFRGLGTMATRAVPYIGAGMVLKDGFDVVAGTDGGATKENKRGLFGGLGGAGLGAAIGTFLLPGIGTMLGAGIGAGIGNLIGSHSGRKADERDVTNEGRKQATITSPSMQGPTTSNLSFRAMDSMTDVSTAGSSVFSTSEINKLDQETPETKALALILAENKASNRKLQQMIHEGLIMKGEKNRTT